MKLILFTVLSAFALVAGRVQAAESSTNTPAPALPKVYLADPQVLAESKRKFAAHDASLQPAFKKLITEADKALKYKVSPVTEKKKTPPSGDKHDYMTTAPYFWPNPKTTNGLPYIRKDGQRNPESREDSDETRFVSMSGRVQTLGLAYYLTGEEKYAAKAAEILRVFFLDAATRMNPNLNYGQAIRGVNDGRGGGLIETHGLPEFLDALNLLASAKSWPADDQKGMEAWLAKYFDWLGTSKNGLDEAKAKNNHGNFYDGQYVALALHLGQTNLALEKLQAVKAKRIAFQVEPDGKQPLELARTKSLGYSSFSVEALMNLSDLGRNSGVDLWGFKTEDGRSLQKALDYLLPYADPAKKWPHQQIAEFKRMDLGELILRASGAYPDAKYAVALKFFPADELASNRIRLLFRTANPAPAHASKN